MPVYDLIYLMTIDLRVRIGNLKQLSLAGRVRDVVQTLTCRDEIIVPNEKVNHVKAALYTIVPRSPFFAFCTPKYFRLQKGG